MATDDDIFWVQLIIGYNFQRVEYLKLALTAAGADEKNHDGNRKLAQLGESLIESILLDNAYSERSLRSDITKKLPVHLLTCYRHRE